MTRMGGVNRTIIAGLIAIAVAVSPVPHFQSDTAHATGSGWIKKNGKKLAYRFRDNSKATGVVRIGKKIYFFNSKGRLRSSAKERMIRWNGSYYDVKKNGVVRKGWNTFGKGLYYFGGKLGARSSGKVVSGITLRDNGRAYMSLDASVKYKVIRILKSKKALDKSPRKKLRACWNWIQRHCHYSMKYPLWKGGKWKWGHSPGNSTSQSGLKKHGAVWVKKYANDMLGSHRGGNCYGFACAFAACAANIGYDPIVVVARTANSGNRDGRAGVSHDGYSRHGWVRIKGRVYDPEAAKVGWRYLYGVRGIGLPCKAVRKIKYKKVDGSKTADGKSVAKLIKEKLIKKSGKIYYYDKNGRKTRPKNRVVLSEGKYYYFNSRYISVSGKRFVLSKLYNFAHKNQFGYYMTSDEFSRYKSLIKEGAPFSELKKVLGEAKSFESSEGCYSNDPGKERVYNYESFYVMTFVYDNGGKEIVISLSN